MQNRAEAQAAERRACKSGKMFLSSHPTRPIQIVSSLCHGHTSCCYLRVTEHTHHLDLEPGLNREISFWDAVR